MLELSPTVAGSQQALMTQLDAMHTAQKYRALSTGGLVIGSTSKKEVKIASTIAYLHDGVFKSKTTAEVGFTATTHDIAPNASAVQEAVYLLCLIADGTPSWVMGTIASGAGLALLPEVPSGKTVVGYVRVAVAAGATLFNATTDDLDAAHLTVTYVNLGYLAPRFDSAQ